MKEILYRANQYLLFSILLVIVLYYGKVILIPIVLAALLAMLMATICDKLDARNFPRAISCAICVLILVVALAAVVGIIVAQFATFSKDVAQLQQKATAVLDQIQQFVQEKFDVTPEEQVSMAKKQVNKASAGGGFVGKLLGGFTTTVAGLVLTLVYTFLFLYNKEQYESFFLKLYKGEDPQKVKTVVNEISTVAKKYLTGRAMSILILATLYSIGLLLVGIKNAILLAGIAALLTFIPYVGSTLGGLFPFIMALVTEDSYQPALWVAGVIIFIQTVDNYFIEPNVVGGEVNLSALASILGIVVGGTLWGVAGMALFIPMLGIAKIIFDHVESLKPFGYLIGDPQGQKPSKIKVWIKEKLGQGKKKTRRHN